MKLIIAYVQPHKVQDVKEALFKSQIYKMSISPAMGCGQQAGYTGSWRGVEVEVNLLRKTRIEIAVNDEYVETTIRSISKGAQTGSIGDGKIFVLPLEQVIRIRNEERGKNAIG